MIIEYFDFIALLFRLYPVVFVVGMFLLGCIIGSYLNVVIYRLPIIMERQMFVQANEYLGLPVKPSLHLSLSLPRSFCPSCSHKLSLLDNVPLISYLVLGGCCRYCDTSISARYFIIELFTGVLTGLLCIYFGFTVELFILLIIVWCLICIIFIDLDHMIIPGAMCHFLIWTVLLSNALSIFTYITLLEAVLGTVLGYVLMRSINTIYRLVRRKDGIGEGDWILMAVIGSMIGYRYLIEALLIASILGLLFALLSKVKTEKELPFGPALVCSGVLVFSYWVI